MGPRAGTLGGASSTANFARPLKPHRNLTAVNRFVQQAPSSQLRPFASLSREQTPVLLRPPRNDFYYSTRRRFHDYFVTHLPSSSLHPDSQPSRGSSHKLPRDQSIPHSQSQSNKSSEEATGNNTNTTSTSTGAPRSPAAYKPSAHHTRSTTRSPQNRDTTVVRIPLKSAKHHYGASNVRGTRPYNEDAYQAGTIEVPAFAKRSPKSLTVSSDGTTPQTGESETGDPQVFYFGVFDGHGGDKCSIFLRDTLHEYIEDAARDMQLQSSLLGTSLDRSRPSQVKRESDDGEVSNAAKSAKEDSKEEDTTPDALCKGIVTDWRDMVGGYFRRFKPDWFPTAAGGKGQELKPSTIRDGHIVAKQSSSLSEAGSGSSSNQKRDSGSSGTIEQTLEYAFLQLDYDFITTQAKSDPIEEDGEDAEEEISLGRHHHHSTPPPPPFLGGSTASIALISTPTPVPYWHPTSPFTLITAHVGDTRVLLCQTSTGDAIAVTPLHHPSSPDEAARLRRYAASFSVDSFGEERFAGGMANTRAFGDMRAKRVGVSAEPSQTRVDASPAEFAFMVLISDGVTASLSDQEVVDVVKESKTPEQAASAVTSLAEELAVGGQAHGQADQHRSDSDEDDIGLGGGGSSGADNATCLVVRLGGWERRNEGGGGSLRTREQREWRREEANDPRRGRM